MDLTMTIFSFYFMRILKISSWTIHTNKLLISDLKSIIYNGMVFIFSISLVWNPHGLFILFCLPKADEGFMKDNLFK